MFKKDKHQQDNNEEGPPSPKFGSSQPAPAISEEEAVKHTGTVGKSQHQFLKLSDKTPEPTVDLLITPDELAAHVHQDDAWLSLNGVVYDVTKYLKHHPGGKAKMMQGCGIACDHLFNKYHPWVNGKFLLQKFKVGHLTYAGPK